MQVKLWPKNEEGLKTHVKENPVFSVAKLANWAIAQYLTNLKIAKKKK